MKWGIGQKGKDNGVLLTVAVKDHKYRFEVGYGLESTLPDSLVGSLGREYLAPNFRKGDYAGGIVAAVTEIISKLSEVTSAPEAEQLPLRRNRAPTPPSTRKEIHNPALILTHRWCNLRAAGACLDCAENYLGQKAGQRCRLLAAAAPVAVLRGSGDSDSFSGGGGDFGGGGASGDW